MSDSFSFSVSAIGTTESNVHEPFDFEFTLSKIKEPSSICFICNIDGW